MRRLLALLATCSLLHSTTLVHAAPPSKPGAPATKQKGLGETLTGQAKQDYEAAKLLFTDGDHAGALIKFQAVFDTSKDPRLLWNLAACHKSLRHYASAIGLLRQ